MRTTTVRIASLAAVACALTWLLGTTAPAAAGTYTVNACAAERFGFSTQAFVDLGSLGIPTSGMYMRRACAPTDAAPFGLVAGNVVRAGRVRRGHQAGFVLDAPPGTSFLELKWSGRVRRRDCRYALQMYALGPDGSPVKRIRNWRANRNCAKSDNRTQIAQVGGIRRPVPFPMPGATRIVQRSVCVGGSRKRFCSARSINRIQTFWAEATIADGSPPAVAIVQDNPFTRHRQPGAAIHEPPPRPRLDHGALEAERTHVVGPDGLPVVEPEVPVAVRMDSAARTRAGERHCHHTRDLDQPFGELAHGSHSIARAHRRPGASHLDPLRLLSFVGAAPDRVRPLANVLAQLSPRVTPSGHTASKQAPFASAVVVLNPENWPRSRSRLPS